LHQKLLKTRTGTYIERRFISARNHLHTYAGHKIWGCSTTLTGVVKGYQARFASTIATQRHHPNSGRHRDPTATIHLHIRTTTHLAWLFLDEDGMSSSSPFWWFGDSCHSFFNESSFRHDLGLVWSLI
jgi:hypothetical protein